MLILQLLGLYVVLSDCYNILHKSIQINDSSRYRNEVRWSGKYDLIWWKTFTSVMYRIWDLIVYWNRVCVRVRASYQLDVSSLQCREALLAYIQTAGSSLPGDVLVVAWMWLTQCIRVGNVSVTLAWCIVDFISLI